MKKLVLVFLFSLVFRSLGAAVATQTWTLNDPDQFIYDSDLITIGTDARLTNILTPGLTLYSSFAASTTVQYGLGSKVATVSGASIIGGRLDCTGGTIKYLYYDALGNADFAQTGCFRFNYIPNYSGAPVADRYMIEVNNTAPNNLLRLYHTASGQISIVLFDSSGTLVLVANLGAWSPTAGTLYEFELNYDFTAGAMRLFLNGIQFGATKTNTCSRSTAIARVLLGSNHLLNKTSDQSYTNVSIFSTVQHTANYTSGKLPTYLPYSTDDPHVHPTTGILASALLSFCASQTETAESNISWVIHVNTIPYYYSATSSTWLPVADTHADSNTADEISANITKLSFSGDQYIAPGTFLHSDTGEATPVLFCYCFQYIVGGLSQPTICRISGKVYTADREATTATVRVIPERDAWVNSKNILVFAEQVETTTDSSGFFYLDLIRSSQYERVLKYKIQIIKNNRVAFSWMIVVPNQSAANLENLVK